MALVAGLGKACEIAKDEYVSNEEKCRNIKAQLIDMLNSSGIAYHIIGDQSHCVASAISICFNGVSSEALMLATKQYCSVSNGSACNSNSYKPSYVLTAMGIPEDDIESTVRISWGPFTSEQEFEIEMKNLIGVAKQLVF